MTERSPDSDSGDDQKLGQRAGVLLERMDQANIYSSNIDTKGGVRTNSQGQARHITERFGGDANEQLSQH